jgi:hypothetical protein
VHFSFSQSAVSGGLALGRPKKLAKQLFFFFSLIHRSLLENMKRSAQLGAAAPSTVPYWLNVDGPCLLVPGIALVRLSA